MIGCRHSCNSKRKKKPNRTEKLIEGLLRVIWSNRLREKKKEAQPFEKKTRADKSNSKKQQKYHTKRTSEGCQRRSAVCI
jgi:hypothetical protein